MSDCDKLCDCGTLISDLLGLDVGTLGAMSPSVAHGNDRALLGLGMIVRRALELSVQLRDRKQLVLRLKSNDEQARAWGFGDTASVNLAMLLAWAALRSRRYCRGFRYAPLVAAAEKVVDLPPTFDRAISAMSNEALLDAIFDPKPYPAPAKIDETTPDDVPGASLWDLTKTTLRLYPADLASGQYDAAEEMIPDLVSHPEQLAGNGLALFLNRMARQYFIMRKRAVSRIQLRTEKDAIDAELPNARMANLMTILAASLHADEKHRVSFLAPEERSDEETDMLRRAARWVYMNYNHQSYDGFSLLCDSNRHFGTMQRFTVADRLLHSVRYECDPNLEHMPIFVRAIEAGLGRPSAPYRLRDAC